MNDRAIELSEKRHVELVLYARGLEVERDRLLELIRAAQGRLTIVTKTSEMSAPAREAIQQVVRMLRQYS